MAITFFLSATVALSVFNITLSNDNKRIVSNEKFYQMDEIIHEKIEETEKTPEQNSSKTNQAFNKSSKPKHFAKAYKPISPPKDLELTNESEEEKEEESTEKPSNNSKKKTALDDSHLTAFNSVNSILSKRSKSIKATKEAAANTNSSIYYSLQNRTHEYLPIPVYLCNSTGKIVVNIIVNAYGIVTKASINSSSTSHNECLKDHALEYAKKATFNGGESNAQIGTITFTFKGK